jgi:glycosyltransferase involved in cell wall biosynthesis
MDLCCCIPAYEPAAAYGGPVSTLTALRRHSIHEADIWTAQYGVDGRRVALGTRTINGARVRYFAIAASRRWLPITPTAYRAARRSRYDIAHMFGLRDGLTIPAAAGFRRAGIPYIVEPMGMLVPRVRSIGLKRAFDAVIGNRHLRGAAGLVATSHLEEQEIRAAMPRARIWVRTNPIVVDTEAVPDPTLRKRLGVADDELLVGYVGRISTKKGLDVLANALAMTPDVQAVVIGPDSGDGGEAQLASAVARNGLRGRVHRLPAAWGPERDSLVAAFDAFVLPSRTENFGNAAAEAAALGVPVILSTECGVAEDIEKFDAGIVTAVDADDVAQALARLRDDVSDRTRLGENGRRLADELTPAKVAAQQDTIYREVIG